MLAMKSRERRMKKLLEEECEKYQRAEFNRQIELMNEQLKLESRYNAMLHVLYFMIVLYDEEGIGAKRLSRYFEDFIKYNEVFKTKLKDGIAWTYVKKRFCEIGLEITDIDFDYAEKMFQKKYEEGVNRSGVSVYKE